MRCPDGALPPGSTCTRGEHWPRYPGAVALVEVRIAPIAGVSTFAQPARERPALIGMSSRHDVEVQPLIGIFLRYE